MTESLDALADRARTAEQKLAEADDGGERIVHRLAALMRTVEEELTAKRVQVQGAERASADLQNALDERTVICDRLEHENEQLRTVLQSLLQAVERQGPGAVGEVLIDLETKVAALVAGGDAVADEVAETEPQPALEGQNEAVDVVPEPDAIAELPAISLEDPIDQPEIDDLNEVISMPADSEADPGPLALDEVMSLDPLHDMDGNPEPSAESEPEGTGDDPRVGAIGDIVKRLMAELEEDPDSPADQAATG